MICPKCGFNCTPGVKFCEKCGTPLEGAQPQYQQPQYQQPQYQQPQYQQPQYQQPQYQQPYQQPYKQSVPGKGFGIASMVCGIVSLVLFCIWYLSIPCAIVAASLGVVGYNKSKNAGFKNGMATAGVVTSVIALALTLIFWLLVILGVASSIAML